MLAMVKQCARMEALCVELARQDPDNSEHWRAEAQIWHQLAGRYVTHTFGEVNVVPPENEDE